MNNNLEGWYVVKQTSGQCAIVPANQTVPAKQVEGQQQSDDIAKPERWGPYDSQKDAIAHRVGLIRAGKCQPV